jgi:hypothetical protein
VRTISYGGGVQSTALLVLAAFGDIRPVDVALFANTGDDSEHPATLAYVRDVATPWAESLGIPIVEVRRTYADGRPYRTLYETLTETAGIGIPVRLSGGVPGSRTCTAEWKAGALSRWRRNNGAIPSKPFVSLVGFSIDEAHRANKSKASAWEVIEYPLLDLGLSRNDCENIICGAGLPVPPKSACWFCPWKTIEGWRRMKADEPELFAKAVDLEAQLSAKSQGKGNGPVYMTDALRPLPEITVGEQHSLPFNNAECDEGVCWV